MGWLNDNDGVPLDTWPSHHNQNEPQTKREKYAMAITIAVCLLMLVIAVLKLNDWLTQ